MPHRRTLRAACLGLIAVLYVMSVPWYREPGAPLRLWLGLPDWVAVALLCYVAVAIANAAAWLLSDVSDEIEANPAHDPLVRRDVATRREGAGAPASPPESERPR